MVTTSKTLRRAGVRVVACVLLSGSRTEAESPSLFNPDTVTRAFIVAPAGPADQGRTGPSLFSGAKGLLAPKAHNTPTVYAKQDLTTARLLDLIGRVEAGPKGYNAVNLGAKIAPPKPPSTMTIAEINAWVDATPGQPHAIGRYQFIPSTLQWLAGRLDVPENARFSPELQDRLAVRLLEDAGLAAFETGVMDRTAFMTNLAKTWAGLPTPDERSYYDGLAGNKALITWARFDESIRQIFGGA